MPAATPPSSNGDLNNTSAMRVQAELMPDPTYLNRTLEITAEEDDASIRTKYRPFILSDEVTQKDWISKIELSTALKMSEEDFHRTNSRLKILMLYGSLRSRSYSKLLTYEAARILHRLGCDVRIYDHSTLPIKDDTNHTHPKVQELRDLSRWSDGHVWISPEQHGAITAVFKNQIDWIPLSTGSVRPTQGRTLAVAQVSGGSQSFNTVNTLRLLGRWMRMFVIPNQSSVPMAYKQFTDEGQEDEEFGGGSRMVPGGNRDRLVDCMEELVKFTIVMRQGFDLFGDRYSEREEKRKKVAKEEDLARVAAKEKSEKEGNGEAVNGVKLGSV